METEDNVVDGGSAPQARGPYVVGIGASAGGLSALKTLLASLPPHPGLAFVVVLHLSPRHESHLAPLLQPYTRLRVVQVRETIPIQVDHVYIIPPNANLSAIDSHLRLTQLESAREDRAPINHFFRTLAATHDGRGIGVILTGAGSDGALGMRRVKEQGGLTIAQDPVEAEFDGMPRSAIETGMVDLVLPLREIAREVLRFCAVTPQLSTPDADELEAEEVAVIDEILGHVRRVTGHDVSVYRRAVTLRRMRHRMQLKNVDTIDSYRKVVFAETREAGALASDLMLSVTEFFSSPSLYRHLEIRILPQLFSLRREKVDSVRVWSIGCATGEEAYSLAILLLEQAERSDNPSRIQLFASDIADEMLQRARAGVYPHEIAESLSPDRLARFFEKLEGGYRVRAELRDSIVFAAHDLFKDPPFAHLDLIVCRNLLRELQPEVRLGVLKLLRFVLEPHGQLIVGNDDPVNDSPLFELQGQLDDVRIYRPSAEPRPRVLPPSLPGQTYGVAAGFADDEPRSDHGSLTLHHARLMSRYLPPSVLVDGSGNVVHYSQGVDQFLRQPGGEMTHDLTRLVGRSVRTVIRDLVSAARRERQQVASGPLTFETRTGPTIVIARAEPAGPDAPPGTVLVVFDRRATSLASQPDPLGTSTTQHSNRIRQLEGELDETKTKLHVLLAGANLVDRMRSIDGPAADSADQMIHVMSELETSRKELQSANNELLALDHENAVRVQELAKLGDDLRLLLESTGIATLVLDRDLRILRFTPELGAVLGIRAEDRGRLLSDLKHGLRYEGLPEDAARVIEHLARIEREIESDDQRWFLARLLPYRTSRHAVEGVVITLVDITDRRRFEQELRELDRRKDEFLALLAHELRNPLAPIITGIEVLKRMRAVSPLGEPVVATLARQARQLVRLVDDLLDVSRVTGGRLQLRRSLVAFSDIVQDAVASVQPVMDRAAHELTVHQAEEPIVLDADGARLTQVLANLLNNAARYTPNGGQISLSTDRAGPSVIIRVKDNGIGISPENAEHIFDMFYQGNAPGSAHQQGLGIGLTLAKSLIEMHGGSIAVRSAGPGGGSEFVVQLPVSAGVPAVDPAPPAEASIQGHRVLIVDDNLDAAQTLKMLIDTLGSNHVRVESSGQAALKAAAQFHPDLVLLDLLMPEMDGFETARQLRAQPGGERLMLVAVSGWGMEEHKRRARVAGFDQHLTKPADRASLQAVLEASGSRATSSEVRGTSQLH